MDALVQYGRRRTAKLDTASRWPVSPGSTKCAPTEVNFYRVRQQGGNHRKDGEVCGETGVTRRNEVRAECVSLRGKQHRTTTTDFSCQFLQPSRISTRRAFSAT